MKRFVMLALVGAALALPAAAETATEYNNNVKGDAGAIAKDNAALGRQKDTLEQNRLKKAHHKRTGEPVAQAVDSVKIGANHVGIAAKKTEKAMDKDIKSYDEGKPNPGPQ